jgi:uncharacterized protein (DUF433 family)
MGHLSINPNILNLNQNHFILWFVGLSNTFPHFSRFCEKRGSSLLLSEEFAMPLDWSTCAAVESVPGKVSGAWVFRGTRIPVSAVFENLEDGLTVDDIVQMFDGLARDQVVTVLDFAAQSLQLPTAAL